MNSVRTVGIGMTALGVGGYVVGVVAAYPGRAFSVTGVIVGLTLWAVGRRT